MTASAQELGWGAKIVGVADRTVLSSTRRSLRTRRARVYVSPCHVNEPPPRTWDKASSSSACPDKIFVLAVSRSNHSARSTSGKDRRRPLLGGHSISNELLESDSGSKSISPANAITRFRPRCRTSPSFSSFPIDADGPSHAETYDRQARPRKSTARSDPMGGGRSDDPCRGCCSIFSARPVDIILVA
jgi:hypothetical protein